MDLLKLVKSRDRELLLATLRSKNYNPATLGPALVEAITSGWTNTVEPIIRANHAIVDYNGGAPILAAALSGRYEVAKILVRYNVKIIRAALEAAIRIRSFALVELFLGNGIKPTIRDLDFAIEMGDFEIFELIYKALDHAFKNEQNNFRVLQQACARGNIRIVAVLLGAGCSWKNLQNLDHLRLCSYALAGKPEAKEIENWIFKLEAMG